jgi:lysozyme
MDHAIVSRASCGPFSISNGDLLPTINRAIVARIAGAALVATALFTAQFEGFSNKVYVDPVGHHAVCVGHDSTGPDGKPLRAGDTYTDDVCSYLLGKDVSKAQASVIATVKVPLSDGETLAYTDFVFNEGEGNLASSTLVKKLNAGDHAGACNELPRWDKGVIRGRSVTLPGLVTRRAAELRACLG